jgi:hypothetical protein
MFQPPKKIIYSRRRSKEVFIIPLLLLIFAFLCLLVFITMHWNLVLSFLLNTFIGISILAVILTLTIQVIYGFLEKFSDAILPFLKGAFAVLILVPLRLVSHYGIRIKSIAFSSYLSYYFPEEVVAEIIALQKELIHNKESSWLISDKDILSITYIDLGILFPD